MLDRVDVMILMSVHSSDVMLPQYEVNWENTGSSWRLWWNRTG